MKFDAFVESCIGLLAIAVGFAVVVGLPVGWILNIIELLNLPAFDPATPMHLLRIVGIVIAPLGGVLGWL